MNLLFLLCFNLCRFEKCWWRQSFIFYLVPKSITFLESNSHFLDCAAKFESKMFFHKFVLMEFCFKTFFSNWSLCHQPESHHSFNKVRLRFLNLLDWFFPHQASWSVQFHPPSTATRLSEKVTSKFSIFWWKLCLFRFFDTRILFSSFLFLFHDGTKKVTVVNQLNLFSMFKTFSS